MGELILEEHLRLGAPDIWYEIRTGVMRSGKLKMVVGRDIPRYTGFQSIYGVSSDTARHFTEESSIRGMSSETLYSDTLFIDIDDDDEAAEEIKDTLRNEGTGFLLYHTGNRGWHFHVDILPMSGIDVPHTQKMYVKENFRGVDLSLYKSTGMLRLPNTFHTKSPGNYKKLVFTYSGVPLEITRSTKYPFKAVSEVANQDTEAALDYLLSRRIDEGGRNTALHKIASLLDITGESKDTSLDIIVAYNRLMVSPPVSYQEIVKIINSVFRG